MQPQLAIAMLTLACGCFSIGQRVNHTDAPVAGAALFLSGIAQLGLIYGWYP